MSDLAWMKTYIGDEAAVTGHLNAEEFGAFERLRRHYWQHGRLPEDDGRLVRIAGVEPAHWSSVFGALEPLLREALPRLDRERSVASEKRERKVAAGRKGAASRWGDGNTNAVANGYANGNGAANGEPIATSTSTSKHSALEEGTSTRTHTHTRAREPIPDFRGDRVQAGTWVSQHLFPGDPGFDECVDLAERGNLTWADVERAAS